MPYPLADRRPLVSGRSLVYDAKTSAQLGVEFYLVSVVNGQTMLTSSGETFVRRIEWDGDVAVAYKPDPNPQSAVRIDPDVRFGKPAVKGISTEVIWEQDDAGEDAEAIAETYQLEVFAGYSAVRPWKVPAFAVRTLSLPRCGRWRPVWVSFRFSTGRSQTERPVCTGDQ